MKKIFIVFALLTTLFVGCGENITMEEAKEIALKEVDGEIVSAQSETDDNEVEYEIIITKDNTSHELKINGKGKIVSHEQKETAPTNNNSNSSNNSGSTDNSNSSNNSGSTQNYITAEEANQIAINSAGGGTVTSNELDSDDATPKYDIEINLNNVEYNISVHAVTGEVIERDSDLD